MKKFYKTFLISLLLCFGLISCNHKDLPHYKLETVELIKTEKEYNPNTILKEDIFIYNIEVSDTVGIYKFNLRLKKQIPSAHIRIGDSIILSNDFIERLKK